MADTPNTTTALKTKAALALLAIAGAMMIGRPAAAQTGDATEKQILFTMATLAVAQKNVRALRSTPWRGAADGR